MRARAGLTYVPPRRGELPQVSLPHDEIVFVRQEHVEESAVLAARRPMRRALREEAEMRVSSLPEDVPQVRRVRGCRKVAFRAEFGASGGRGPEAGFLDGFILQ